MITTIQGYSRCGSCNRLFRAGLTVVATHRDGRPIYRNLQELCKDCYLKRKQLLSGVPAELHLIRLDRKRGK